MKLRIGILRETKNPPDTRVALIPSDAKKLNDECDAIEIIAQSSETRCYSDKEYTDLGIMVTDDISDCDVLIGVKEVAINSLIPNKTYMFFSHTAKKQEYNKPLLRSLLDMNIEMIDYEYITQHRHRVIGFGRWAGIIGAYNTILGYGKKTGKFELMPVTACNSISDMRNELSKIDLSGVQIAISGIGHVGLGVLEMLSIFEMNTLGPMELLSNVHKPGICLLHTSDYLKTKDGWFGHTSYMKHPENYKSVLQKYLSNTDIYIATHFWDKQTGPLLSHKDYTKNFNPTIIGDISCDIKDAIASTIRPSTFNNPFYGYDKELGIETDPWKNDCVTVMAVDNLPNGLPRESSKDFSNKMLSIIPLLSEGVDDPMIEGATICDRGKLTKKFKYLNEWINT